MSSLWKFPDSHEKKLDVVNVFVYFQVLIEKTAKGGNPYVRSGQNRGEAVQSLRR